MPRALELARFTVKPENVDALFAARPAMVAALRTFPGFIDINLGRLDETTFVDVVLWESREQAEAAAAQAPNHPGLARIFSLIDQTLAFEHADVVEAETARSTG